MSVSLRSAIDVKLPLLLDAYTLVFPVVGEPPPTLAAAGGGPGIQFSLSESPECSRVMVAVFLGRGLRALWFVDSRRAADETTRESFLRLTEGSPPPGFTGALVFDCCALQAFAGLVPRTVRLELRGLPVELNLCARFLGSLVVVADCCELDGADAFLVGVAFG